MLDGRGIGTLIPTVQTNELTPEEQVLLERTNRALVQASLGAILLALFLGLYLAQRMSRPIVELTGAARAMAAGDLEQRVEPRGFNEIDQLAEAFNQMSHDVALQTRLRRQMTADIAHDLRTPLTAIAGYVEAMRDGDLPATQERPGLVFREVERLQHLVADLRILSQADAGELRLNLQPMPPAALMDRVAATHRHQAEQRGVQLWVDGRADGMAVRADEARLSRVFDNLVDNAVQHTPTGGEIVLSASPENGKVVFTVRDSGQGIPEEDLPRIFDRFYRGERARSGDQGHSGLGLAIARALVEAHGGSIRAESRRGEGSKMVIVLPREG